MARGTSGCPTRYFWKSEPIRWLRDSGYWPAGSQAAIPARTGTKQAGQCKRIAVRGNGSFCRKSEEDGLTRADAPGPVARGPDSALHRRRQRAERSQLH